MRRGLKRTAGGCLLVIVLAAVVIPFTEFGKGMTDLIHHGLLEALMPKEQRKWDATSTGNLHAIYTALMLYEDSEGAFPKTGWMDAIKTHLRTTDMKEEEAAKKLVRPDLAATPDVYGYSINGAVAGKYHGDVKDPKTVLIYESKATTRNAEGDPAGDKGRLAVTVDGSIVRVK